MIVINNNIQNIKNAILNVVRYPDYNLIIVCSCWNKMVELKTILFNMIEVNKMVTKICYDKDTYTIRLNNNSKINIRIYKGPFKGNRADEILVDSMIPEEVAENILTPLIKRKGGWYEQNCTV